MKRKIISVICTLAFMLSLTMPAMAAPRASYYFSYTDVYASAVSDGGILVEIEVEATHSMTKIGATDVYIYEQQSDGSYDIVYTYTSDDYSGLLRSGSAFYNGSITYPGTVGTKYYATCALYCKDANGSETMFVNSNIVTARE